MQFNGHYNAQPHYTNPIENKLPLSTKFQSNNARTRMARKSHIFYNSCCRWVLLPLSITKNKERASLASAQ
jgi:hypothetical protein